MPIWNSSTWTGRTFWPSAATTVSFRPGMRMLKIIWAAALMNRSRTRSPGVKSAVQSVCGPEADMRDFHEARDYAACVAKASHDAMGAVPKVRQQASQPAAHAG